MEIWLILSLSAVGTWSISPPPTIKATFRLPISSSCTTRRPSHRRKHRQAGSRAHASCGHASADAACSPYRPVHLWLGDVDGLARHQAGVDEEQPDDGVHLEEGIGKPDTARERLVDPALAYPPGHEGVQAERRRDGGSLEVLRLAALVLGNHRSRHIEAGKAGETAKNIEGEADVVGRCAKTDREGGNGGGDTEGYL